MPQARPAPVKSESVQLASGHREAGRPARDLPSCIGDLQDRGGRRHARHHRSRGGAGEAGRHARHLPGRVRDLAAGATGAGREPGRARQRDGERHHQRSRLLAGTAERGAGRGAAGRRRARRPPRRVARPAPRSQAPTRRRPPASRPQVSRPGRWRSGRAKRRHPKVRPAQCARLRGAAHADRPCASGPADGLGHHQPVAAEPQTTVAVKRSDDRPSVARDRRHRRRRNGVQVVRPGDRFNDPWMRAMIVSPSAQGFMRTTLYGAPGLSQSRAVTCRSRRHPS